jgi:hypothetical protein
MADPNLDQATQLGVTILRQADAAQQVWKGFSPQARIVTLFSVTFMIGALLYTLPFHNTMLKFSILLVFTVAFTWMGHSIGGTTEVSLAMSTGAAAGGAIWLYYFYKKYREEQLSDSFGLVEFICEPKFGNICAADGTSGPFNGTTQYVFHTDKKTPEGHAVPNTNFIPASEFKMDDPFNFSYSFWLRVSYDDWASPPFFRKNKPVILRTNGNINSAVPGVWLAPESNALKVEVATNRIKTGESTPMKAVTYINYPMDQWVQYGIVIRACQAGSSFELYKNGLLEKTVAFDGMPDIKRSKLFVGEVPPQHAGPSFSRLPGQMLYLAYYNKAVTPEEMQTLYEDQRSKIVQLPPPPANLQDATDTLPIGPDSCPTTCTPKSASNVSSELSKFEDSLDSADGDTKLSIKKKLDTSKFDSLFDGSFLQLSDASSKTKSKTGSKSVEGFDGSAEAYFSSL